MIQINDTILNYVEGTPLPLLQCDDGTFATTQRDPQSLTRFMFFFELTVKAWGATYLLGNGKTARFATTLPNGQPCDHIPSEFGAGSYEGPSLDYGPPPSLTPALHVEDLQIVDANGKPWQARGHCDFLVHKRALQYGLPYVRDMMNQRRDTSGRMSNCVSSLGMWYYGEPFNPLDYGEDFFDIIPAIAEELERLGAYWCPILFADFQVYGAKIGSAQTWLDRWTAKVRGRKNILPFLVNEYQKAGFDPFSVAYPAGTGCLWSRGSSTGDSRPPEPGWDVGQWEGRRDDKAQFGAQDAYYVEVGHDEDGTPRDKRKPVMHSETMGAWSQNVPNRRSNEPDLFRKIGLTTKAYMHGGALAMTEECLTGRPWENQTRVCVSALWKGLDG